MAGEPHRFEPSDDKKSADVYDNNTGEYLGTVYPPDDKTTDDYREADGQYWFNNEGEFVPAAEEGDDDRNSNDDQGSDKSNDKQNDKVDPETPPPDTPPDTPPGPPPAPPPAGEDEPDPDYAVGEDQPWEDDWDEDDWDNEDEGGDGDDEGGDGQDPGDQDNGDGPGAGPGAGDDGDGDGPADSDGNGNGAGGDDGTGTGDDGTGPGAGGDTGGSKTGRQKAEEARQRADEARDRATLGQEIAADLKALIDAARKNTVDAKAAQDDGEAAKDGTDPNGARNGEGAGVAPPATFSVNAADPVDLCSGAFKASAVDFVIDTIGPALAIVRHHSSQLYAHGIFGAGVECWLDASIRTLSTSAVVVRFGDGNGGTFGPESGGFDPPFGCELRLHRAAGIGHELHSQDGGLSKFDAAGRIIAVADAHGNILTVERDAAGRVARVVDAFGGALHFTLDGAGRVTKITDPAGQDWRYNYDTQGRLVTVFGPATPANANGLRARYGYQAAAGDPRSRAQIERVENAAGEIVVRNIYGVAGHGLNRVVEQLAAGGRWQFDYSRPAAVPAAEPAQRHALAYSTVVTNPVGTRATSTFNAYGALLEQRLARPGRSTIVYRFIYDADIRPERMVPPQGGETRYQWMTTAAGLHRVAEVRRVNVDPGGQDYLTRFAYDGAGRMISVTAADGGQTDVTFDAAGRVTRVRYPAVTSPAGANVRPSRQFSYDARGRITQVTEADGMVSDYAYDAASRGLLASISRGGQRVASWQYNALGRVTQSTDEMGAVHAITYDGSGNVIRETGAEGIDRRYRYDASDRMIRSGRMIDGVLIETIYSYDGNGRCIAVASPLDQGRSAVERVTYDTAGQAIAIEPPASARVEADYDERGLMTELRVGPGTVGAASERFAYDIAGNLLRHTDRRGQRWTYRYDGLDRLIEIIRPDGAAERFDVDILGRTLGASLTDSAGRTVEAARSHYDALGRVTRQERQLLGIGGAPSRWIASTASFDLAGRPLTITDAVGGLSQLRWTADGALASVHDPLGNRSEFDWDLGGRLTALRDISAGATGLQVGVQFTNDMAGRVRAIADSLGNRETITYDAAHRVTAMTRADGTIETRTVNAGGRLKLRTTPWNASTSAQVAYSHDDAGRLTALTDADGQRTELRRTPVGQIAEVVGPTGAVTAQFEHDADGSIARMVDARGVDTRFTRDGLGQMVRRRITKPVSVGGITDEYYSYDAAGRLVAARNADHSYSASYDSLGRIVSESSDGATTLYHYGADLLPNRIECPGGTVLNYSRDGLGRVTSLSFAPPGIPPATIDLGWVGSNRLGSINHGNGLSTDLSHDRAGRLMRLRVSRGATVREQVTVLRDGLSRIAMAHRSGRYRQALARDAMGQVTRVSLSAAGSAPVITPWLAGGSGTQATLDTRRNALNAAVNSVRESFEYTPGGDRVRTAGLAGVSTYALMAGHRYQRAGTATLSYDASNNVTDDGDHRYIYDHASRLVRVEDATGVRLLSLTYDPVGRLKTLTDAAGVRTVRHYLGLDVVEEVAPSGVRSHALAFGLDQSLAVAEQGQIFHLHRDHIWSVIAVSDASGALIERYDYSVFGTVLSAIGPSGAALATPPRFAAFQGRPALLPGLIDVRQRVLHAGLGRFLQCDPAGIQADAHPYRFALNDPTMFVDPTGEIIFVPILVGLAVGAGISAWANRDKSGADFWVAVGAGAVGGAIAGSGLGTAGFILGGAVSGVLTGGYEGAKVGGVKNILTGAAINGAVGAVAGGIGGAVGARFATGVTGSLNASLLRGALRSVRTAVGGVRAYQGATYVGTMVGGGIGGAAGGLSGGALQGTGTALLNGEGAGDAAYVGIANGIDGAIAGIGPGIVGGVASKAGMQLGFAKSTQGWRLVKSFNTVFGREGEFFGKNQSGNAKGTTKLPDGAEPDMDGNNLPWADKVYGDVKNTAEIPVWSDQPSKSGIGQLQQIYDAVPNRFDRFTNPTGNKMTLYVRPGARVPGGAKGLQTQVDDGSLVVKPLTQYVFAPPDTAGSIK